LNRPVQSRESAQPGHTTLAVKVSPRASGNAVMGWSSFEQEELLVKVTAAASEGKANEALIKLIAVELNIPRSAVHIVRGATARHKLLRLDIEASRFDEQSRRWPVSP